MPNPTVDQCLNNAQTPQFFSKSAPSTLVPGAAYSYWYAPGIPGAATIPSGLYPQGEALVAPVPGQIPFTDPVTSGWTNFLARFAGVATSQPGTLVLADRLWHNYNLDVTSTDLQTIFNAGLPDRGIDPSSGLLPSMCIGLEVMTTTGAASPSVSLGVTYLTSYLPYFGIITTIQPLQPFSPPGTFYTFANPVGSDGVFGIENLYFSTSWLAGSAQLVIYRPIAAITCTAAGVSNAVDPLTGGIPRMWNGTVPFLLFFPSTTIPTAVHGSMTLTQGLAPPYP